MSDALKVSVLLMGREILSRTFAKDNVTIGRHADCDLRLNSSDVSRRHASLQRVESCGYLLRDLGSANGTYVGDERVSLVPVRNGGNARIGKFELAFSLVDVPWNGAEDLATPHEEVDRQATMQASDEGSESPPEQTPALDATQRRSLQWILDAVARLREIARPERSN